MSKLPGHARSRGDHKLLHVIIKGRARSESAAES
jgi:hypothetical protein